MKWILIGARGGRSAGACRHRRARSARRCPAITSPAARCACAGRLRRSGRRSCRLTAASGVPVDIVENDPPRRLVSRVKETEKMFGGTWTVDDRAVADRLRPLTITEDGWVGNPIFRFVSRFVIGHHATMDGMLKVVAKKFGEEPELSGDVTARLARRMRHLRLILYDLVTSGRSATEYR